MTRNGLAIILAASFGVLGCTGDPDDVDTTNTPPPGSTSGNEETTYDHDNDGYSPWELIDRLAKEGPPRYTSKVHSCPKVRYRTLSRLMTSVGIDPANMTDLSAGKLYQDGRNALGDANFANRIRENIGVTTSGASRMFDIFAAGAPEVIAALTNQTLERCKVNGVGVQLFEGNSCRADGITCLIGVPAQAAHIDFCNKTITDATDPAVGQRLAVAALLAAAHTCE